MNQIKAVLFWNAKTSEFEAQYTSEVTKTKVISYFNFQYVFPENPAKRDAVTTFMFDTFGASGGGIECNINSYLFAGKPSIVDITSEVCPFGSLKLRFLRTDHYQGTDSWFPWRCDHPH